MKNTGLAVLMASAALALMAASGWGESLGRGQVVVTVLPKVEGQPVPASVAQQDLAVKVNGNNARVTTWKQYTAPNNRIELVLLIDGSSRTSLGLQMKDIAVFVNSLPPNVKAGIAYMENGQAVFVGPLSSDHAADSQESSSSRRDSGSEQVHISASQTWRRIGRGTMRRHDAKW